jgi:hypothetical protein
MGAPGLRCLCALSVAFAGIGAAILPSLAPAAGGSIVTITAGPAEGETVTSDSATFSFHSDTQATFKCVLDGGAEESCDSGQITYTGLANGTHRFDVIATTTGHDVVSGSETRNWTVAVLPQVTITDQPPNPSESPDATFSFTSDQSGTFECTLDGGSTESCTSPVTYHGLHEGSHSFAVRAVGPTDATGPPAEYRWEVKAPPPSSIETSIVAGPPDPSASPDASFSFSATVAGATFHCALDGASAQPCTSPVTYSGLADGRHTFKVSASHGSLVDESPAEYSWTVARPVGIDTTITSKPSDPSSSGDATFEFTSNRSDATFECSLDGPGFAACTSPVTYSGLSNGGHTFEVRAVRGGTIDSTPARYTWTVDASGSGTPTWVWIVVGLAVAAGIGVGVWYLLKRRREGQSRPPEPPEPLEAPPA